MGFLKPWDLTMSHSLWLAILPLKSFFALIRRPEFLSQIKDWFASLERTSVGNFRDFPPKSIKSFGGLTLFYYFKWTEQARWDTFFVNVWICICFAFYNLVLRKPTGQKLSHLGIHVPSRFFALWIIMNSVKPFELKSHNFSIWTVLHYLWTIAVQNWPSYFVSGPFWSENGPVLESLLD